MLRARFLFFLSLPTVLFGQLIPPGQPLPKMDSHLPVVFLNGYQFSCPGGGSTFSGTFGNADKVLQDRQIVSVFFDNCTIPGSPSIEALGQAFGRFLAGLK